jgi:hypothetical protein
LQELLAIQQSDGPKNLGFFGTRNMGMTHQKLVEILSYAMVSTVSTMIIIIIIIISSSSSSSSSRQQQQQEEEEEASWFAVHLDEWCPTSMSQGYATARLTSTSSWTAGQQQPSLGR